jgi:hypothetical protein
MNGREIRRPTSGDGTTPAAARMVDYLLGDARNLAADRRLADTLRRAVPDVPILVRLARTFMRRAVTYLVAVGVQQFLDLSIGTTAVGNVHEVAQAAAPASRVVYVHSDPVSVAHTQQLLEGVERTAVLQADPRDPWEIMAACRAGALLDLAAPVGLLMVAGLALLPDSANLVKMVAGYRDHVVPGSHLVVCHLTGDQRPAETATLVEMMSAGRDAVHPRTHEEVVRLFTGFELVPPGVVDAGWRAERQLTPVEELAAKLLYAGVGRKPEQCT